MDLGNAYAKGVQSFSPALAALGLRRVRQKKSALRCQRCIVRLKAHPDNGVKVPFGQSTGCP